MLSYWSSDLDLEVASWFPFGIDYKPVSINLFYSPQLKKIANFCLEQDSEFFLMASPGMGYVGSLMRDNFYKIDSQVFVSLGFMMVLGYSQRMEKLLSRVFEKSESIKAGVAFCSLWVKNTLMENLKVIVLVSEEIFFDDEAFLTEFEDILSKESKEGKCSDVSYFAEKFGYRRFSMAYETDDLLRLRINKLLYEMEFAETHQMVGPSPEISFPLFFGVSLGLPEND